MKKIILCILLYFIFLSNVDAFNIDINKIQINGKSNAYIKKLDSSYKIDTKGFDNEIVNNEEIEKIARELTEIVISDNTINNKRQLFTKYSYTEGENGTDILTALLFLDTFFEKLDNTKINGGYIQSIKTILINEDEYLTYVYVKEIENMKDIDVIFTYWMKNADDGYKVYYPAINTNIEIMDYFDSIEDNEKKGNEIGSSYNSISLTGKAHSITDNSLLKKIYDNNKGSVVQVTSMDSNGTGSYGSGFYIRGGVVVTTWSIFLEFLSNSNYLYINDAYGNTYDVQGVISADVDYDVVLLKVNKEVGKSVIFGNSSKVKTDDKLFMINSKNNKVFTINYGSNISNKNGRLVNMLVINNSDVGAALFDINGNVIGINTDDQLYSDMSYANSTDYLIEIQKVLKETNYLDIKYTSLNEFKDNYYLTVKEEKKYNMVTSEDWNKYDSIGNIKKNITLDLVKASCKDNILSLRYKDKTNSLIDSLYLLSNYTDELIKQGFTLYYRDNQKVIYTSNDYRVIIKDNLNYLVILIMEN